MKVLIIKTSSFGDIIQALPTLTFIRDRFPEAQIDWVVEERFSGLVKALPMIDNVICFDSHDWRKGISKWSTWKKMGRFFKRLRETKYDVAFDLQSNCKSGMILWRTKAKHKVGFGKETVHEFPNLLFSNTRFNPPQGYNIREDYLFLARSYFSDDKEYAIPSLELQIDESSREQIDTLLAAPELQRRYRVMICPGSAWSNKQLTQETLGEFLQLLDQGLRPSFLAIWGSENEKVWAERIHAAFPNNSKVVDKMGLPVLQNLMQRVDLVISMDSLPLHLAGTTKTPTFSVFGASASYKYKPEGARHFAYQGSCPYGQHFIKRCSILRTCTTGSCVHSLEAKELFKDFAYWWKLLHP
jgi:heptosyltransferase-1